MTSFPIILGSFVVRYLLPILDKETYSNMIVKNNKCSGQEEGLRLLSKDGETYLNHSG